jgi:hypothetical protein
VPINVTDERRAPRGRKKHISPEDNSNSQYRQSIMPQKATREMPKLAASSVGETGLRRGHNLVNDMNILVELQWHVAQYFQKSLRLL